MKRAEKRKHLIKVAADLFNQHGYHAVGIDYIIKESGIAKTTLYRHFNSKTDLIVAVLSHVNDNIDNSLNSYLEQFDIGPIEKILKTFDHLEIWTSQSSFNGCQLTRAISEYSDISHPVFIAAQGYKRSFIDFFEELATEGGLEDARSVAIEINLLYEGVLTVALSMESPSIAQNAKHACKKLLGQVANNF